MKFLGNMACALLSVWFLAGCVTEPPPVEKKFTDARIELVNNDEFSMELLSSNTKVDDSGLLTVDAAVALSNTPAWAWIWGGDPKINLSYRFQWIDAKGASQEAAKHVIPSLPGNIVSIHGVAPSERVVNFKLRIVLNEEENNTAVKAEAKPEVKTAPKAEAAKPAVKADMKPQAKPAPKAEAAKPVVKAEAKPEVKPAPKAEAAKPAMKAEAKPEVKPAPKADAKAEPGKPAPKPVKLTEPFE